MAEQEQQGMCACACWKASGVTCRVCYVKIEGLARLALLRGRNAYWVGCQDFIHLRRITQMASLNIGLLR